MNDHALDAKLEEIAHQFRMTVSIEYAYDSHKWIANVGLSIGADKFSPEKALERAVRAADRFLEEEEASMEELP